MNKRLIRLVLMVMMIIVAIVFIADNVFPDYGNVNPLLLIIITLVGAWALESKK